MKKLLLSIATFIMLNSTQGMAQGGGRIKDLNLTNEQKAKLQAIRKANKAKMDAINAKSISEEEKKNEIEALKANQKKEAGTILTPEQVAKMKNENEKEKAKRKEQKEEIIKIKTDSTLSKKEKADAFKQLRKEKGDKIKNADPEKIEKLKAKRKEMKNIKEVAKTEE